MGSLHFNLTRLGTMNLVAAEVRRRIFGARDSIRLVTSAATNRRVMGSSDDFWARIGIMNQGVRASVLECGSPLPLL